MSDSDTSSPTDLCWFCWPQWHTATVCKWVKLVCQQQKYLDTLQHPVFPLGSLRCVILSPSEYTHGSQSLSSPWCLTPEPEYPHPSPPSTTDTSVELFLTSWLGSAIHQWSLWWILSILLSKHLSLHHCTLLWGSKTLSSTVCYLKHWINKRIFVAR